MAIVQGIREKVHLPIYDCVKVEPGKQLRDAELGRKCVQRPHGRTDLPGGSTEQLLSSIKNKLMTLDDDVKVYSGHGPVTTIGEERLTNPFLTRYF